MNVKSTPMQLSAAQLTMRHIVTHDPSDVSANWLLTHVTHDLQVMIIAYRLHICCINSQHEVRPTHNWNRL